MSGNPGSSRVLCPLEVIPDGEGKGFELEDIVGPGGVIEEIVVVRQGDTIYGYRNVCPHAFTPLNWQEDKFMTLDKHHILCATHGAEFQIADGVCVAGPCIGDRLTEVAVRIEDGMVILTTDRSGE